MVNTKRENDSAGDTRPLTLINEKQMNEQTKEQYEAPDTNHVQVEMEDGICAASVTPQPNDDVAKDRHVIINKQEYGGEFDFTEKGWE